MNGSLQKILLRAYRLAVDSGALSTRWGRSAFDWAYHQYKARYEVGSIEPLRAFVSPESWIIDVGANVGFFTRQFAGWVSEGGKVLAIEPEPENFRRLQHNLSRNGLAGRVEPIQAVASDSPGTLRLQINPYHPADHRIGVEGVEVRSVVLDEILADRKWPRVSLMKIDVQGAEERVLRGAEEILRRFRPALFIEIDDDALRKMDTDAATVVGRLAGQGYGIHKLRDGGLSEPMSALQALEWCRREGYGDFCFLHSPAPALYHGDGSR